MSMPPAAQAPSSVSRLNPSPSNPKAYYFDTFTLLFEEAIPAMMTAPAPSSAA